MLDADDVQWLLVAVGSVAAIVVVLAVYANRLERRYTRELSAARGSEEPEPDELPVRYHAQVLAQAGVSYYISLLFAGLGFLVLVDSGGSGRGTVAAILTEAVAALFFIESRKSRSAMLEQTRALRAEGDERRREEERARLIAMVTEGEARDRLLSELVLSLEAGQRGGDPARRPVPPSYATVPD
jgi:hypothetical protein